MRYPLTSETATAVGPYSHGVVSDPFVLLSGQTPLDPGTATIDGASVDWDYQAPYARCREAGSCAKRTLLSGAAQPGYG